MEALDRFSLVWFGLVWFGLVWFGTIVLPQLSLHSPVGDLTISEHHGTLTALDWGWTDEHTTTPLLLRAHAQLQAYFDGNLRDFDLPLSLEGSPYRVATWRYLATIPYGQVIGYAALANAVGGAPRSAGGACGANRLPIIIPCHRVVGVSGLTGYSGGGGVNTKAWLLEWEQRRSTPAIAA